VSQPSLADIVSHIHSLPAMPAVALELLQTLSGGDPDVDGAPTLGSAVMAGAPDAGGRGAAAVGAAPAGSGGRAAAVGFRGRPGQSTSLVRLPGAPPFRPPV